MKFIKQDPESTVCGHCCLAMVTGKELSDMIELIGHEEPLNYYIFTDILGDMGYKWNTVSFPQSTGLEADLSGTGIIRVARSEDKYGQGHAVAFKDGRVYDPMNWEFDSLLDMLTAYYNVMGSVWCVDYVITLEGNEKDEQ